MSPKLQSNGLMVKHLSALVWCYLVIPGGSLSQTPGACEPPAFPLFAFDGQATVLACLNLLW